MSTVRTIAIWVVALLGSGLVAAAAPVPAQAAPVLCGQYDSAPVGGGRYVVQNNRWGASTAQCIDVAGNGFTVTQAGHANPTNGPPAGYPSIFAGCHYATCTSGSGLPLPADQLGGLRSSVSTSVPSGGEYNVSYDLWFDPTRRTDGQNTGAELMIWINRAGRPQPIGSRVATVDLAGATWDVWIGDIGWNVISFVRTSGTLSVSGLDLDAFTREGIRRGQIDPRWFLTSVQFGFEPWTGGAGLAARDFSLTAGGTPQPPPPPAPSARTGEIVGLAGRCLDVSGERSANGTPIIIWDCLGNGAQRWTVGTDGTVRALGKCLDVPGGQTANGTRVWLWDCNGGANQRWAPQANGNLLNPGSGKVLDIAGQDGARGTPVQIWEANRSVAQPNQVWRLP